MTGNKLDVCEEQGILVLTVKMTHLGDWVPDRLLQGEMRAALEAKPHAVVLDLANVEQCTHRGYPLLLWLRTTLDADGIPLVLCRMHPHVRWSVVMVSLERFFCIKDTLEAALEAVQPVPIVVQAAKSFP